MRLFGDLTLGPQAFAGAPAKFTRRSRAGIALGALVLAGMAIAGCGPVGYMNQVHRRAAEAVEEARRSGAETAAPYEYTSAVAYLAKAREEGAEAEYGSAIELGRRAEDFAARARAIALRHRNAQPGPDGAAARDGAGGPDPAGKAPRRALP